MDATAGCAGFGPTGFAGRGFAGGGFSHGGFPGGGWGRAAWTAWMNQMGPMGRRGGPEGGPRGRRPGPPWGGPPFGWGFPGGGPGRPRQRKGDVRAAVLALLAEQPMHGYQIISEIEQRSGGSWKPSAGSVYPTLQLLADEGLITATESNGRKTYSLTDAGQAAAVEASGKSAPWASQRPSSGGSLTKAGIELAQAAAQIGRSGSPEQVAEAVKVLEEARRRLYSILAEN